MTWYIVVTREHRIPISRHPTVEDAGNKIHRELAFDRWTVLAQDGSRSAGPARGLTKDERLKLEKTLYPSLYE